MTPLVTVRALRVEYLQSGGALEGLGGVDLNITPGERLAIIGESGSGKSTFALALAGLLPDNAKVGGRIEWPGLGQTPIPGRDIGFVFQDPSASLDPVLTVGEQIAEVARAHLGLTWLQSNEVTAELLERVHLPDPHALRHAFPHQLSGGQRQRVAIAAAIAGKPRLLIADEATSALDTIIQAEIVTLLDQLVWESKMTLIFVTHDIALASGLADRIAVFYGGRLVEAGNLRQVLTAPRHPYTSALISSHIGLDAVPFQALPVVIGQPPDLAHLPQGCRFAPRCAFVKAECHVEPYWRGRVGDGAACVLSRSSDILA